MSAQKYIELARLAYKWESSPFAAHTSLRPYMKAVPREKMFDRVDRGFWLGEILTEIRQDAENHLSRPDMAAFERELHELEQARDRSLFERRRGARPNPAGDDADAAVSKYEEFHRFGPKRLEMADIALPRTLHRGGRGMWVTYRSMKVDPTTFVRPRKRGVDYIHEFNAGVTIYVKDGDGQRVEVPEAFRNVGALVKLGTCLGFCFKDGGDKVEAVSKEPMPDLCATPDGKCLVVVQGRKDVLAMIWGGALGVFARGIDG